MSGQTVTVNGLTYTYTELDDTIDYFDPAGAHLGTASACYMNMETNLTIRDDAGIMRAMDCLNNEDQSPATMHERSIRRLLSMQTVLLNQSTKGHTTP